MDFKSFNTPEGFFKSIPTNIQENIEFRIELHKLLAVDKKAQQIYLELCRRYYPIFFSSTAWTLNPQKKPGERNQPFILRPAQIPAVERLNWCIDNEKDAGLNKSRKKGASELCCKLFTAKALLEPDSHFIIGSRKKELVDNFGDPYTLFAKVDNVFNCLPSWWKELSGYDQKNCRKDMNLVIPATNSSFSGETTNENFGAGSRGTSLLLDEFGRVDYALAESIEGSVHDVSNCVIYSSTHWLGPGHTFNKCIHKESTEFIELLWYTNPEENLGLYTTPEPGVVEILDVDYYKENYPELMEYTNKFSTKELPDYLQELFVADGLRGIPSPYRAPWFDTQEKKRKGNKRDFICNVCGTPLGASDAPFDAEVLETIRSTTIRNPDFEGEIYYISNSQGRVDEEEVSFYEDYGSRRLKWWGRLPYGRPDQHHNYIIGVDPSYGLGSANSAAEIYDVNSREQVGSWVDSNTKPEDFADMVVAMAYWIGGVDPTYIIWESNAGCGANFTKRVVYQDYYWVYTQRREDAKTRKKTQKWGWASNENAKEALLGDLGVALSGGLTGDKDYLSMIIHEEELLSELSDYVFKEKGKGLIASSRADLGTGAAERHGDRAIAAGLCLLGAKDQIEGNFIEKKKAPVNSFQYHLNQFTKEERENKRELRRFLF